MNGNVKKLMERFDERFSRASMSYAGIEIKLDNQDAQLVKSLVGLLAEEDGFRVAATENGIRIAGIDHLDDETLGEIVDVVVKATGSRMNLAPKRRMVQQNKPVMGYPKNGGLAAVSHKYNCMVSGEKRANPCAGCGNPKGCLSGVMQFKGQDIDG